MKLVEKNPNGFSTIGIVAVVAALVVLAVGGYFAYQRFAKPADIGGTACTQEAKLCPNGSSVSRTGPNCEFAACPEASQLDTSKMPQSPQSSLVPEEIIILLDPTSNLEKAVGVVTSLGGTIVEAKKTTDGGRIIRVRFPSASLQKLEEISREISLKVGGIKSVSPHWIPGPIYESSESPTVNWKTYRNEQYGFAVKYPPEWELVDETPQNSQIVKAEFKIRHPSGQQAFINLSKVSFEEVLKQFYVLVKRNDPSLLTKLDFFEKEILGSNISGKEVGVVYKSDGKESPHTDYNFFLDFKGETLWVQFQSVSGGFATTLQPEDLNTIDRFIKTFIKLF